MATGGPGAGDGAISADPGEAPRLPRLPLRHLPTGLQGLLLPHPRGGQLIQQPPCGVRVMVSWRSRALTERQIEMDGTPPPPRRAV